jgi:hypothetical protein
LTTTKRATKKKLTVKHAVKIRVPIERLAPAVARAIEDDPALARSTNRAEIVIVDKTGEPVAHVSVAAKVWNRLLHLVVGT